MVQVKVGNQRVAKSLKQLKKKIRQGKGVPSGSIVSLCYPNGTKISYTVSNTVVSTKKKVNAINVKFIS